MVQTTHHHRVKKQTRQKATIYNRCHSLIANEYFEHKVGSHLRWIRICIVKHFKFFNSADMEISCKIKKPIL